MLHYIILCYVILHYIKYMCYMFSSQRRAGRIGRKRMPRGGNSKDCADHDSHTDRNSQ